MFRSMISSVFKLWILFSLLNGVVESRLLGSKPLALLCPIPESSYLPHTTVIPISKLEDFNLRLNYKTSQHVTLELQNDITGANLFFDTLFSNTTLISKCGSGFTISSDKPTLIPLAVVEAHNFNIYAVNISISFELDLVKATSTGYVSPLCSDPILQKTRNAFARNRYFYGRHPCPALLLSDTSDTQVYASSFYGSITMVNVSNAVVDGNFITTLDNDNGIMASNMNNGSDLTFSPVIIRNNLLNATNGISLGMLGVQNAMGIEVVNNNISNYRWSGITLGTGAMLNHISHNFVYHSPRDLYPVSQDSPGIYIAVWRYGVNNSIEYNYLNVSGVSHCFYNDYWSGGTNMDCNICAHGAFALKQNMGWSVRVSNYLAYDVHATFAAFCEVIQSGVCSYLKPPKPTPAWLSLAPWIFPMCESTSINGIPCSTDKKLLEKSGNCSGLSLLNSIDIATVKNSNVDLVKLPKNPPGEISHACGPYPIADLLNHYNATIYSVSDTILDENGLVHVVADSALAKDMPCLADFPYSSLGVQWPVWGDVVGILKPELIPDSTSTDPTTSHSPDSTDDGTGTTSPSNGIKKGKKCSRCNNDSCRKTCSKKKQEHIRYKEET